MDGRMDGWTDHGLDKNWSRFVELVMKDVSKEEQGYRFRYESQ